MICARAGDKEFTSFLLSDVRRAVRKLVVEGSGDMGQTVAGLKSRLDAAESKIQMLETTVTQQASRIKALEDSKAAGVKVVERSNSGNSQRATASCLTAQNEVAVNCEIPKLGGCLFGCQSSTAINGNVCTCTARNNDDRAVTIRAGEVCDFYFLKFLHALFSNNTTFSAKSHV